VRRRCRWVGSLAVWGGVRNPLIVVYVAADAEGEGTGGSILVCASVHRGWYAGQTKVVMRVVEVIVGQGESAQLYDNRGQMY
jgi:hypothetical protein